VVINYRLGFFAWLRVNDKTPGNYGFLDQVQALKWIQANIARFGGDPRRITIGGQSAGANSVLLHLTSPASKGLFHRAFVQSSMALSYYPTKVDATATSNILFEALTCDAAADLRSCLENIPTQTLMEMQYYHVYERCLHGNDPYYGYNVDKGYWYCGLGPEVGNRILPGQYQMALDPAQNPSFNSVPILIGTDYNEGLSDSSAIFNPLRKDASYFYSDNKIDLTQYVYTKYLNQVTDLQSYENNETSYTTLFSKRAKDVYKAYPYDRNASGFVDIYPKGYNGLTADSPLDANYVFHALYHDKWYLCPTMATMSYIIASQKQKKSDAIYMYRFGQVPVASQFVYNIFYSNDPITAVANDFFSINLYPSHGDDIPFFHLVYSRLYIQDELNLANHMFSSLVNLIYTGNPNKGPMNQTVTTRWEAYNPSKRNMLYLSQPEISEPHVEGVRDTQCTFWEKKEFVFSTNQAGGGKGGPKAAKKGAVSGGGAAKKGGTKGRQMKIAKRQ